MINKICNALTKTLLLFLLFCGTTAADTKKSGGGMLDFNVYPYLSDVERDSFFTLNIANNFAGRISYFSLLNLIDSNDSSNDVNYYTEQNLRWQISKGSPFDLTLQLNYRSGEYNDRQ